MVEYLVLFICWYAFACVAYPNACVVTRHLIVTQRNASFLCELDGIVHILVQNLGYTRTVADNLLRLFAY